MKGVIYGQFSVGGVFILQCVFAFFNILAIVYLISILASWQPGQSEEVERVRCILEMQALAEPNHETWSSLVMATSATSPAIVAFQLPVMVLLEKFKPHLLLRLNRRLS